MKKFLFFIAFSLFTLTASAQHYWHPRGGYHYHGYGPGGGWLGPVIVGGVIGYELSKANNQNTVIVQQPSVIVEQQPTTMECGPWKEIQTPDGKTYKERTCYQK